MPQPPAPGVADTLKGLPNWAVGLFGGLGVLVVGLGIFSVTLRARDEGAEAARARTQRPPRPPAPERTMPSAVVEPLAPSPSSATFEASDNKPEQKVESPRPRRRKSGMVVGEGAPEATESPGAAEIEAEAEVPTATPPVVATREPEPEAEGPPPSLADAERMQQQMESILASLAPRIEECAHAADVAGEVEVRVAVSQDGTVKASKLVGDLDGTAAASCIQTLVKQTRYQRFKGPSIKLSHRFSVQ